MEPEKETKNKVIQTYAEDMAKVIEDDKTGLIKKVIHEQEEQEIKKRNLSPDSKKNKFFIFASLLFILTGFSILFYFMLSREVPSVPIERQFIPLIFNDKSTFIEVQDLTRENIIQSILNGVNATKVKLGGVEGIYLTYNKKVVGLREFIKLIKANFQPKDDVLIYDNFLMGVVNTESEVASETSKDFFILLKARSTDDIFDAMRVWEKKMFSDLRGFFGVDLTLTTKNLLTANFEDGIVENKNARVLYNSDKDIVMMYVFANDTSVIITNTKKTAREIMLRLSLSQIKK